MRDDGSLDSDGSHGDGKKIDNWRCAFLLH